MPSYKNNGSVARPLGHFGTVGPGKTGMVEKYVPDAHEDFELVSHSVWRTNTPIVLFSDALPSGDIQVLEYATLLINNETDASISIVANDDTANAVSYPAGTAFELELHDENGDQDYHHINITGSGSGSVHVWGWK